MLIHSIRPYCQGVSACRELLVIGLNPIFSHDVNGALEVVPLSERGSEALQLPSNPVERQSDADQTGTKVGVLQRQQLFTSTVFRR